MIIDGSTADAWILTAIEMKTAGIEQGSDGTICVGAVRTPFVPVGNGEHHVLTRIASGNTDSLTTPPDGNSETNTLTDTVYKIPVVSLIVYANELILIDYASCGSLTQEWAVSTSVGTVLYDTAHHDHIGDESAGLDTREGNFLGASFTASLTDGNGDHPYLQVYARPLK